MPKVSMGRMTWSEIEEAVRRDAVVLLPLGTLETQGRHAPMGYDYLLAERLAIEVAGQTDSLVTPTLPFGYSHFSRPFPGTISLQAETLRAIFTDLFESLIHSGFNHLLCLNNHGLNEPILGHVADQIREAHRFNIFSLQPSKLARDLSRDLYDDQPAAFAHGGEPTISLMLHLYPDDMAQLDEMKAQQWAEYQGLRLAGPLAVRFKESTIGLYTNFKALAPGGGMGDITQASAEKGRIMFERMTGYLVDFIDTFKKMDTRVG